MDLIREGIYPILRTNHIMIFSPSKLYYGAYSLLAIQFLMVAQSHSGVSLFLKRPLCYKPKFMNDSKTPPALWNFIHPV